jgi:hypothetical protein
MKSTCLLAVLFISGLAVFPGKVRPPAFESYPRSTAAALPSAIDYPSHDEIVNAIAGVTKVYAEFDRVSNRIDASNWKASKGNQRSSSAELNALRNAVDRNQSVLASLRSSPEVAASQLYVVLDDVTSVSWVASDLASKLANFQSGPDLAADLEHTSIDALNAATALRSLFERQMLMEELELQYYRSHGR